MGVESAYLLNFVDMNDHIELCVREWNLQIGC